MSELKPATPLAVGYEAVPESGSGPGVLVLHAWWGLNDTARAVCDRLAAAGFVAVAPDLWGGTVATTIAEAEGLIGQRDDAAMFQAASDGLAHLRAHPAVRGEGLGAVGFSMGAGWGLYLIGVRPELRALVIFYGSGEGDFAAAQADVLGHFAANDPYEDEAYIAQMEQALTAAGRQVQFHRYPDTGHWFCEPDRADAYRAEPATVAWERTLAFLRERLG